MRSATLKILLVSSVLLLASLLLAGASFWYQNQSGNSLKAQLLSVRDKESIEVAYNDLLSEQEDLASEKELLNQMVLAGEPDTIKLLSTFDNWARNNGIVINTSDLKLEPVGDGYSKLFITLTLRGNEGAVLRMVRLLELLPYRSKITRLNFTRQSGQGDTATTQATLTLEVGVKE